MYKIGQIAKLTGLSIHTLRYYEKESLIFPKKNDNGDRLYSDEDIKWLNFLIKLRESQMPISKIKEYVSLYLQGDSTRYSRLNLLLEHQNFILNQIDSLLEINKALDEKINTYRNSIDNKENKTSL